MKKILSFFTNTKGWYLIHLFVALLLTKKIYLMKKGGFFMVYAGEKPGIGKYKCIQCGKIVELTSADEVLPICPQCEKTVYIRIC